MRVAKHICTRCAEPQVKRPKGGICIWCGEELLRSAVRALACQNQRARTEATFYLRERGYSAAAIKDAQQEAKGGVDIELVVKRLEEPESVGAAA